MVIGHPQLVADTFSSANCSADLNGPCSLRYATMASALAGPTPFKTPERVAASALLILTVLAVVTDLGAAVAAVSLTHQPGADAVISETASKTCLSEVFISLSMSLLTSDIPCRKSARPAKTTAWFYGAVNPISRSIDCSTFTGSALRVIGRPMTK